MNRLAALFFAAALVPTLAQALDLSTPEAAAASFLDAAAHRDMDGLVGVQDFAFEAREALGLASGSLAPDDQARVARKAAELEAAYRARLSKLVPIKSVARPCQYVSTLASSRAGYTVVFDCPSPAGGDWIRSIRVVESEGAWRVVLDVAPPP